MNYKKFEEKYENERKICDEIRQKYIEPWNFYDRKYQV